MVTPLYEALPFEQGICPTISGQIQAFDLPESLFGIASFGDHRCTRSKSWLSKSEYEYYYIQLVTGGAMQGTIGNHDLDIQTNDIYISDVAQPCSLFVSHGSTATLIMGKAELEWACGRENLHGTVIKGDTVIGQYLGVIFTGCRDLAAEMTASELKSATDVLASNLARAIFDIDRGSDVLHQSESSRIRRYIVQNITRQNLRIEDICRDLNLSRSQVYRVLESEGGPATFIRRRRLDLAYRALASIHPDRRQSLKELAFRFGFPSAASFSSAFENHFGVKPSRMPAEENFKKRESSLKIAEFFRSC